MLHGPSLFGARLKTEAFMNIPSVPATNNAFPMAKTPEPVGRRDPEHDGDADDKSASVSARKGARNRQRGRRRHRQHQGLNARGGLQSYEFPRLRIRPCPWPDDD
jgi:hypothetical protein